MQNNRAEACSELLEAVAHEDIERLAEAYPDRRSLKVDLTAAAEHDASLVEDILRNPGTMLETLDSALRNYPALERPMARARVRLTNLPEEETLTVGDERVTELHGCIALEGQVTKRTEVLPKLSIGAFECQRCGEGLRLEQPPYGRIREPRMCPNCGPDGYLSMDERESEWVDYQKVRLQQPPEEALDGVTATMDIHITGELCASPDEDGVQAGMRATFVGRFEPVRVKDNTVHEKTLLGNSFEAEQQAYEDIDTDRYEGRINELAASDDLYDRLIASLAPEHRGDEHVKEALMLQQFAGWSRTSPNGSYHRGNSHVFLIGDPGAGKTNLLEAVNEIAPRAAMTDGTGTSGAGLTAALVKDDFSEGEQWTIEAGTLPLAHEGIAVVDELDKGDDADLDAIHTALESQQVYVSKAGKQATLPAETALLAAANPTGGHYDFTEHFAEQVGVQSPLLSRFDLTFVMTEHENPDHLEAVASHMVNSRTTAGKLELGEDVPETNREAVTPPVDQDLLTAYIAYARSTVAPVIRDPAVKDEIVDWFVGLKEKLPNRRDDEAPPLPVTARKIDAVCRLAEASARARLSETVALEDVDRATRLIDRSLADIGIAPSNSASYGEVGDVDAAEVGL